MGSERTFVIVGGGLAGAKAAQTLREEGFDGRVVIVCDEFERPYERPPLSKGYLQGAEEKSTIYVHDKDWYSQNSVELKLGHGVTGLDRAAHELTLSNGDKLRYGKLLLATGACPRQLHIPGADLDNVLYLRRVGDSDKIAEAFARGGRVVIVGAGWIGLETAAAARAAGCEVTVVEPQPVPLHAALGHKMGEFFADLHREHRVDLRLGQGVKEFHGEGGAVTAVTTDDGSRIEADTVIVGVGIRPTTELAETADLPVDNGILVDASLCTTDPDIYAAGDVANVAHPFYGQRVRVEHWDNALGAGPVAAKSMLGQQVVYDRLPFFFTDQYDLGMEFVGWFPPGGYDTVVTRGDVHDRMFYAFWTSQDTVVAGMHVNLWDEGIDPVRELLHYRKPVDLDRLADPAVPLPDLMTD